MKKLSRFMEVFWLVVAVAAAGWAAYAIVAHGFEAGRKWLWFPVVAAGMYGYRRFMRSRMEQWEREGRL
jgi:hypothetical protein